jgi:hypothetical protein
MKINEYGKWSQVNDKKSVVHRKEITDGGLQIGKEQFVLSGSASDSIFTLREQIKTRFPHPDINDGEIKLPSSEVTGSDNIAKLSGGDWNLTAENHRTVLTQTGAGPLGSLAFDYSEFMLPDHTKSIIVDGKELKPEEIKLEVDSRGVRPGNVEKLFQEYWTVTNQNNVTALVQTGVTGLGTIAIDMSKE